MITTVQLSSRDLAFLVRVLEGCDGLAMVRTLDGRQGLAQLVYPPDSAAGVRALLADFPRPVMVLDTKQPTT